MVIVGGSLAGLQAALTLGRARRSVVVIDDGRPRNGPAHHVHNFLGQAAPAPADLLASARSELEPYDVVLVDARVDDVRAAAGFTVRTSDGGTRSSRAIVLATGLADDLPDVPGIAALWGGRVVACPHCHGWEVRDRPLAQLGMRGWPARGLERAVLLSRWSRDVLLFTDGDELDDRQLARAAAAGVEVCVERVAGVTERPGGLQVALADGRTIGRHTMFTVVSQRQQSDLAARLGCDLVADGPAAGAVEADHTGRTSVAGVWAAGTTAFPALLAIGAAGHASTVATTLHSALIEADLTS